MKSGSRPLIGVVLLLLAACIPPTSLIRPEALESVSSRTVLLMPVDVEVSQVVAMGSLEPSAEWTADAATNLTQGLLASLQSKNATASRYTPPANDPEAEHIYTQLQKLHATVARSILRNRFAETLPRTSLDLNKRVAPLATARNRFDWSLGRNAISLRETQKADFALFVLMRDGFSSGANLGASLAGILVGAPVGTPVQAGYASLVDLRSGDVVWFTRTTLRRTPFDTSRDLRDPSGAIQAAAALLGSLPPVLPPVPGGG